MKAAVKRKRHKPVFTRAEQDKLLQEVTLPFVMYFINNIQRIRNYRGPISFSAVTGYEKKIQAYLNIHADRNNENVIHGVVVAIGNWRDGRGNRICVYMSGDGPIFEALGTRVVEKEYVPYEIKTRVMKKIFFEASDQKLLHSKEKRHLHPHSLAKSDKDTIRQELSADHGAHSPVPTDPDIRYYKLGLKDNHLTWVTAMNSDLQRICNRTV